jgi:hypothetical protein
MPRKRNPEALRIEKDFKKKQVNARGSRNKKDITLSSTARPDASGKKPRAAAHHKSEIARYQKGQTSIPSERSSLLKSGGYEKLKGRGTRRGKVEREVSNITRKAPANKKGSIRPMSKKDRDALDKRIEEAVKKSKNKHKSGTTGKQRSPWRKTLNPELKF